MPITNLTLIEAISTASLWIMGVFGFVGFAALLWFDSWYIDASEANYVTVFINAVSAWTLVQGLQTGAATAFSYYIDEY